jgi:phage-related protein
MARDKTSLVFFETQTGHQPVLEWLKSLDREDRNAIGQDLMRLQWRWPVGMPLCKSLGHGLWEVRSTLPSDRIARVVFCSNSGALVALHGFIKKTQKTPAKDLATALRRMKELSD